MDALLADGSGWYERGHGTSLATIAIELDGLAALGRTELIEERASALLGTSSYLEPFVLRALGVVCEDDALIGQALVGFEALELTWHADETRRLL
jgi:hypothetical protein